MVVYLKLKHLMQAYRFNRIPAAIDKEIEENKEKAGVIKYNENINAAYLIDNDEVVISLNMFCNCITKDMNANAQINHSTEVLRIIHKTIELIGNIPQKEINMILEKLGLFNSTFTKRKENKTYQLYV